MLYLQFYLYENRYVLETKDVVSVTPLLKMEKIQNTPAYVVGLLNYRGKSVPVVDLKQLIFGKDCKNKLSTRIILVNINDENNCKRIFGLRTEKATEVVKFNQEDFQERDTGDNCPPYLGSIIRDNEGILQKINVNYLFKKDVQQTLFK